MIFHEPLKTQPAESPIYSYTTSEPHHGKPYRCPVCEGRGSVNDNFYTQLPLATGTHKQVDCKSCEGEGIVWG